MAVPAPAAVAADNVTLYYDSSTLTRDFRDAVALAAYQINIANAATGVELQNVHGTQTPPATSAAIRFVVVDGPLDETAVGPVQPGQTVVTVRLGRAPVVAGRRPVLVATHAFGRALGLPEDESGQCKSMMSAIHSGPTCGRTTLNSSEVSAVAAHYRR
ncbi:snapalysin family zinc-dependent metalloprotease [Lentzea sp. JNUCC 0626]|uniref:snapalysin family zinc-dependent metalloprotease n=1 Tax=Lentzea sp. JNUCC 0626 TaxID=3367513 RepID=UPI0037487307